MSVINIQENYIITLEDNKVRCHKGNDNEIHVSERSATKEVIELKNTLSEYDWEYDFSLSSEGYIKVCYEDINYLIYLFFGDGLNSGYRINEVEFNNQPSYWCAHNSYILSPLTKLDAKISEIDEEMRNEGLYQNRFRPIVVLMPPAHITNGLWACEELDNPPIISFARFIELLKSGGTLSFECNPSDLKNNNLFYNSTL